MSSSEIIKKRQDRANFIGSVTKQQAFNLGITNFLRGANQPATTSGLLSASDGSTDVTPNQLALTLAKNLGLTDQILQFEQLVDQGITTSVAAVEFNQVALSNPETAIEEFTSAPLPPEPSGPTGAVGIAEWATGLYFIGTSLTDVKSSAIDSQGNVYITGTYVSPGVSVNINNMNGNTQSESSIILPSTPTSGSAFLIKYNSNGIAQWATFLGGSSTIISWSVAIDSSDNVYISGQYQSSSAVNIKDVSGNTQVNSPFVTLPTTLNAAAFLIKYNSNGIAQWFTFFNGSSADIAYAITIDSSDNILITGQYQSTSAVTLYNAITTNPSYTGNGIQLPSVTSLAVFLLKYNSNGTIIWATYFNGSSPDAGLSVKTDSLNNIYLTGFYNSTTIVNIFNAITSGSSYSSTTISLPSVGATANIGLFLIKYNSSGSAQYATIINGTTQEQGQSIAIDSFNNVYLTGFYNTSAAICNPVSSGIVNVSSTSSVTLPTSTGGSVIMLVKFDSNLSAQWATFLDDTNSTANGEQGQCVAIDSLDNVYLTGYSTITSTMTIQNANGNTQSPSSITLPPSTIDGFINQEALLIKYNSNGEAQWATYLNGTNTDTGRSLSIDSSNNIYMSGYYSSYKILTLTSANGASQIESDITLPPGTGGYLVKYDLNGIAMGAANLKGIGTISTTNNLLSKAIVKDSLNNVYIAGQYVSSVPVYINNADNTVSSILLPAAASNSVFFIKYNSEGIAQWATYMSINSTVNSLAIDSLDNIFITGTCSANTVFYNSITSGSSYPTSGISITGSGASPGYLIKYNSSGVVQWVSYVKSDSSASPFYVTTDSQNNVYITGSYTTSLIPPIIYNGITSGSTYTASTINLPSAILIPYAYLIKFSVSGQALWATYLRGNSSASGYSLSSDSSNNIYLGMTFNSPSQTVIIYNGITTGSTFTSSGILFPTSSSSASGLIKYNSSGVVRWATYFDGNGLDRGFSTKIDASNNIYMTGQYSSSNTTPLYNAITSGSTYTSSGISLPSISSSTTAAVFVIKYDSNGIVQWATYFDSTTSDIGYSIALDSFNNIYITGYYSSLLQIPLYNAITSGSTYTASQITLPSNNTTSTSAVFIVKYNNDGQVLWATFLDGTNNNDIGYALTCDNNNKLYVTGSYINVYELNIYNVNNNSQIESSITLPGAYAGSGAFLIKYS
jgi:hypothetical protein